MTGALESTSVYGVNKSTQEACKTRSRPAPVNSCLEGS